MHKIFEESSLQLWRTRTGSFIFFIYQVQLLYSDENLDADVQFLIKRLEILQTDPPQLKRSFNIDEYLASFCKVSIIFGDGTKNWKNDLKTNFDEKPG